MLPQIPQNFKHLGKLPQRPGKSEKPGIVRGFFLIVSSKFCFSSF